jgi:hypothetical protein
MIDARRIRAEMGDEQAPSLKFRKEGKVKVTNK